MKIASLTNVSCKIIYIYNLMHCIILKKKKVFDKTTLKLYKEYFKCIKKAVEKGRYIIIIIQRTNI